MDTQKKRKSRSADKSKKKGDVVPSPAGRYILKEHEIIDKYIPTSSVETAWSVKKYAKELQIRIVEYKGLEMEFDMINTDPAIANCLRRIMLSEVPSMAIEKVFMYNNSSVIPDEVLAHRLGLIPLRADPRIFEYRQDGDTVGTEQDTLEFDIRVRCRWNPKRAADATDPDDMYINHKVYSGHMKWLPVGSQKDIYNDQDVGPVQKDILITKLRPGQEVDLKLHAIKGIGQDHAKFSPVATAFYRLLPEIKFLKDKKPVVIKGEQAVRLQKCFSPGVIKVVEKKGEKTAVVHNARYDSCSRNVLRYEDLAQLVELGRVKNHFIFTIESTGAMNADVLFVESLKVLIGKCRKFLNEINRTKSN